MSSKQVITRALVPCLLLALAPVGSLNAQENDHTPPQGDAQTPSAESEQSTRVKEAREAFMRGVQHMRANRFLEASVAFEESLRYDERASTLCNLAKAYDQRGDQEAKALAYYERCAAHPASERFRDHAKARMYAIKQARIERKLALQRGRHDAPEPGVQDTGDNSVTWMVLGFGALAVGGGVLIGSALVAGSAASTDRELTEKYRDGRIPETLVDGSPNPDVQRLSDAEDKVTLATGLLIGGAVVTTAGLGLLFAALVESAPDKEPSHASVSVALAPGAAAVELRGDF